MLPKEDLLKSVENQAAVTRVLDLAEQAIRTWEIVFTDFLSPPELIEAQGLFQRLTEVHLSTGGWLSPSGTAAGRDRPHRPALRGNRNAPGAVGYCGQLSV